MSSSNSQQAIARIEMLARRDPGARGLASHADTHDLAAAADELLGGERVVIVTGFCIRAAMIGETDGPPGALVIADALRQLGKEVVLVTDSHSNRLLEAGAALYGAPLPIVVLSAQQAVADQQIEELLHSFKPTQVLAIERPGSAVDGHRYSMRGEALDDLVPATDRLLQANGACRTIAIGDGGNELGMGSLRSALMPRITHGELIFCATPADYVIAAGISNWGGSALAAALALRSGRVQLRTPDYEQAVLRAMVAAGAVDGCTRKNELSVDGLPWDEYAQTLADIHHAAQSALAAAKCCGKVAEPA